MCVCWEGGEGSGGERRGQGAKIEGFRVQKIFTLTMRNERDRLHVKSQTQVEALGSGGLRDLASALQRNN